MLPSPRPGSPAHYTPAPDSASGRSRRNCTRTERFRCGEHPFRSDPKDLIAAVKKQLKTAAAAKESAAVPAPGAAQAATTIMSFRKRPIKAAML